MEKMDAGNWRTGLNVEALLRERPELFEFFQAVKIVNLLKNRLERRGSDIGVSEAAIKFSSLVSHSFPASNIASLEFPENSSDPAEMQVNFMGLAGAHGPLPTPITEMILDQARSKNHGAAAFLDIFNNRLIQLFYKSQAEFSGSLGSVLPNRHPVGRAILSIAGLGGLDHHNRLIPDTAYMAFAGLLADRPLSRLALERVVGGLFGVSAKVKEYVGRWLKIDKSQQTHIGRYGTNNELGHTAVLGQRVWDQGGAIEFELGPLTREEFSSFLSDGDKFKPFQELVNFCVDPGLSVRLRLNAGAESRAPAILGSDKNFRLGWSSWLISGTQSDQDNQVVLSIRS